MLSSVTLNCQATMIVMNSNLQLSELLTMSQGSQVPSTVFALVVVIVIVFVTKFLLLTFISFWTEENVISNLNNI